MKYSDSDSKRTPVLQEPRRSCQQIDSGFTYTVQLNYSQGVSNLIKFCYVRFSAVIVL